jgi:hypothetical protein
MLVHSILCLRPAAFSVRWWSEGRRIFRRMVIAMGILWDNGAFRRIGSRAGAKRRSCPPCVIVALILTIPFAGLHKAAADEAMCSPSQPTPSFDSRGNESTWRLRFATTWVPSDQATGECSTMVCLSPAPRSTCGFPPTGTWPSCVPVEGAPQQAVRGGWCSWGRYTYNSSILVSEWVVTSEAVDGTAKVTTAFCRSSGVVTFHVSYLGTNERQGKVYEGFWNCEAEGTAGEIAIEEWPEVREVPTATSTWTARATYTATPTPTVSATLVYSPAPTPSPTQVPRTIPPTVQSTSTASVTPSADPNPTSTEPQPRATPTATTSSSPTTSREPTLPPTPGSSPTSRPCVGDEDGDGVVTIAELVTAVRNALEGCR